MAAILTFPADCKLTTTEIVAMISAVLDEQATLLAKRFLLQTYDEYGWAANGAHFDLLGPYVRFASHYNGGKTITLCRGKLCDVYQPALAWGAYDMNKSDSRIHT